MITSLLECLKNLIESSKISQNYDEYSKDENESFGWQDKEYYILKYRETNKYLQDYVKKSGDCISNKICTNYCMKIKSLIDKLNQMVG